MKSVIIIGCGNIGYRHLQAILLLPQATNIFIVEPNLESHARIASLIAQSGGKHRINLLNALPEDHIDFDLAVIATTSNHRRDVVEDFLRNHYASVMIMEKVLFQSVKDIDFVQEFLLENDVTAYVNCGRRYFPGYADLKRYLSTSDQPKNIEVSGNNFGLASNAIHFIDLAEYLNSSVITTLDGTGLTAGFVAAKRNKCVEFYGKLEAQFSNGSQLTIDCHTDGDLSVAVKITSGETEIRIDEMARKIVTGGVSADFASKHVSECVEIYSSALERGQCDLTPYADSARQHRIYLSAVLTHLGLPQTAVCPIS